MDKTHDSNERTWQRERQVLVDAAETAKKETARARSMLEPSKWMALGFVTACVLIKLILAFDREPSGIKWTQTPPDICMRESDTMDAWERGYEAAKIDAVHIEPSNLHTVPAGTGYLMGVWPAPTLLDP